MNGEDVGDFLDLFYAAAVEPDLWIPAMESLADMLGGSSSWLSRLNVANGTGTGITARVDPEMPARYINYFASRNPFSNHRDAQRYVQTWTPKIHFHEDFLPRDEKVRTEFYNDFLRPQNVDSAMMIGLAVRGLETCVLNINHVSCAFEAPSITLAHRLHPHLRRAFALSRTLGDGIAGNVTGAEALAVLDGLPHAVFLVDAAGRVGHANPAAALLICAATGLRIADGFLSAADRPTASRLSAAIGGATTRDGGRRGGASFALPRPGLSALQISVTPLRGGGHGVFASVPLAMVAVNDPEGTRAAAAGRIRALYGLTPAETRIAMVLLEGCSPREVASRLGVSFQTVRNQLQALYDKTATSRQSALVLLLSKAGE